MTKTALVLVDIQNDYFECGTSTLPNMDAAARKAAKVLSHARTNGLEVIHIQHQAAAGAPFLVAETWGAEINPAVAPLDEEALSRRTVPTAFTKPIWMRVYRHWMSRPSGWSVP